MSGRVVHVRRDTFDLYVGRAMPRQGFAGSVYGNPFHVLRDRSNLAVVLAQYESYLRANPSLLDALDALRDLTLGCWCAPKGGIGLDDPVVCHGQILLKLIEERR